MKISVLLVILSLFASACFAPQAQAQIPNVKTPNKNRSAKYKSAIVRGSGNLIWSNSLASFIGGGQSNTIGLVSGFGPWNAFNSVIAGGYGNTALRDYATIAGGAGNTVEGSGGTIAGGQNNKIVAPYAAIAGGIHNTNIGYAAAIAGGYQNLATASGAAIGAGFHNLAAGSNSVVGGGLSNQTKVTGAQSAVLGGEANTASGYRSVIGGGFNNETTGSLSAIPGGLGNSATNFSFAAGRYAQAAHESSFVWGSQAGAVYTPTESFGANSFTVRCQGGVRFYTTANNTTGPRLAAGGTDWVANSDSNLKTRVTAIDAREILAKLSRLPVTEWEFKHKPNRRYIGPMAQDFRAIFGLGDDDTGIGTLDSDGVMYAAIQGLVEEIKLRDDKIAQLEARTREQEEKSKSGMDSLESKLRAVEERLNLLPVR